MRRNPKKFIAKLLVLCMIVGMLPTIALAAESITIKTNSYSHGSVYYFDGDTEKPITGQNAAYQTSSDTVKIKLDADDGWHIVTSGANRSYAVGKDVVYFAGSDTDTRAVQVDSSNSTVNVYAYFEQDSTGGGGSSTAPSDTTVEAPSTSGGDTTVVVDVKPTNSGTTSSATVSDKNMDTAVQSALDASSKAGTDPVIEVKVETPDTATGMKVTLPSAPLEKLGADNGASLVITSGVAELTLDNTAVEAIAEQAGSSLTISVTPATNLNAAQKEAAGDAPVFDLSITSNGKAITSFEGGVLTVALPYTLAAGQSAADVVVYYLSEAAKLDACPTSYASGKVTFTTTHLSDYVIGDTSMAPISFTDVPADAFYADAVEWAVANNITEGVGNNQFAPKADCTRGQIVTFLWRAAGSPEPASSANPFADVDMSASYGKAVLWAVEKGITTGKSDTAFDPKGTCTRAEAVTFLYRYAKEPAATGSSFSDVPADAYYANAVAWAVANNITEGIGNNQFAPKTICSRGQIVTFLYRDLAE